MFKCGCVALVGVPNVGKSALLNALVGESVAIVHATPQTTRQQITGIYTDDTHQLIVWDTPGVHQSEKRLNQTMLVWSERALRDADLAAFVVTDPTLNDVEMELWARVRRGPHVVVLNKCDRWVAHENDPRAHVLRAWAGDSPIHVVSAQKGTGIDALRAALCAQLPEGPALHDADWYTSHSLRFLTSELIRLAAFDRLSDEIPHQLAIRIDQFEEKPNLTRILASVLIDRSSQKKIVIGEGGRMIRSIGTAARQAIQPLVGTKVYLELNVVVEPGWSTNHFVLQELGLV